MAPSQLFNRGGNFTQVHFQSYEHWWSVGWRSLRKFWSLKMRMGILYERHWKIMISLFSIRLVKGLVAKLCRISDLLLTSYCCHLLFLFQIMRETLIYLSHLDHDDTEQQVCLIKGFCNLLIHESYFNFSGCQGKFSHDAVSVWYWVRFRVKFTQTGMGYVWNKWFSRIIHRQICEHYWGFWNIRMIKQIHRIDSFSFGFRGT